MNLNETRCLISPKLLDEQHDEPSAEPCDMGLNETRRLSPRLGDLDLMGDEPSRNIPLDKNLHSAMLLPECENQNIQVNKKLATESSLSTLHIGSYLDQSSYVPMEYLLLIRYLRVKRAGVLQEPLTKTHF